MGAIALYDSAKTKEIFDMVKDAIPEELKEEFQYQKGKIIHIPLPRNSAEYNYVWSEAKKNGVSIYRCYEFTRYTKKEEKEAKWFSMNLSHPLEAEGKIAASYGTKYTDCCPVCNIGGKVVGDILVDRKFVKKCSIACLSPDIFVSKQVKWLIETSGLSGVKFDGAVKDFKGREIPEYYCMTIENILPPANERTWFTFDPPAVTCKKCGIQVPYLHSRLYFNKQHFEKAKDFNVTHEFINNWAERAIIVSKKVEEVFNKYKIRAGFDMINIL